MQQWKRKTHREKVYRTKGKDVFCSNKKIFLSKMFSLSQLELFRKIVLGALG